MSRSTYLPFLLLASLVLFALAGSSFAESSPTSVSNGLTVAGGPLAIHGFDAVAYFEGGEPQRGLAKFSTLHEGAVYRFASRQNQKTFERNPTRYAPQFGGFCAYGVSVGKKFDGDPEVFRIVDGKLYFNLNPDIKATWEKDLQDNIAKAGKQWPKIRSKSATSL